MGNSSVLVSRRPSTLIGKAVRASLRVPILPDSNNNCAAKSQSNSFVWFDLACDGDVSRGRLLHQRGTESRPCGLSSSIGTRVSGSDRSLNSHRGLSQRRGPRLVILVSSGVCNDEQVESKVASAQ